MFLSTFAKRWGWIAACLFASRGLGQSMVTARLPDSLERGASVIERMDLVEIDIESPRKARMHRKYVYTIQNPGGDAFGRIFTFYDKFHDLGSVSATLYDEAGNVVRKLKKSDLEDWNLEEMGMLMIDTRVKVFRFAVRKYPYTGKLRGGSYAKRTLRASEPVAAAGLSDDVRRQQRSGDQGAGRLSTSIQVLSFSRFRRL